MSGWLFHEAECNGVSPSLFYNKKHKTHTKLLQFSRTSVENDTTIDNWLLLSQWTAKHFLSTLKRLKFIRLVTEEEKMSVGSSSNFQKTRGEKCESVPVWSTLPELKSVFLVVQVRPLHILNTINKTYFFHK